MFGNRTWPAATLAAGLVALAACGEEPSIASKSAAAFEEARKKGQTFGGEGHSHRHGDHGTVPQQPVAGGEHQHHAEHGAAAPAAGHEGMDHSAHGAARGESHADHSAMDHGAGAHTGHAPQRGADAGHEGHAGHGPPPAQAPAGPSGHAGHSAHAGGTPARPPVPELPEQPENILRPDPLDAPAATSVLDAQRSAEMSGGHAGHGSGSYRHVDAGRGPEAALYVCPMHPEVTSKTPGTCPKCGMTLVERREE